MDATTSRGFSAQLGDFLAFTGYLQTTSDFTIDECIYALRNNQGQSRVFGGYQLRFVQPKTPAGQQERPFDLEYYRLNHNTGRTSYRVQYMRGVLYQEDGQTHLAAKVRFTGKTLFWLWLGVMMTAVSVWLLIFSGKLPLVGLIAMTGGFMLAMAVSMYFDRYRLVRLVRRTIHDPTAL